VFGGFGSGVGAVGAAATIFFAYVGFDAVSTAAEETRDPQKNVPIGLIGSLLICTIFYILVAAGAVGAIGGQPIMGPNGVPFPAGSEQLAVQCAMPQYAEMLVCSNEALAHVLRQIGFSGVGNMLGIAAFVALPSVILILLFGQTRIFFVMSRDGLLPEGLSKIHPKWKTPYVVTAITGGIVAFAAAFLPVGQLADIANAGTLYAFFMVAIAVMMLRKTEPNRPRKFKTPALWLIGPDHCRLPVPVPEPAVRGDAGAADLGCARYPDLLPLRLPQQPSRPRHRRGARARDPRHQAGNPRRGRAQALVLDDDKEEGGLRLPFFVCGADRLG
jgi:APA family basic amino acid/polyamine antiporter